MVSPEAEAAKLERRPVNGAFKPADERVMASADAAD
jgi:hypothetical protein